MTQRVRDRESRRYEEKDIGRNRDRERQRLRDKYINAETKLY